MTLIDPKRVRSAVSQPVKQSPEKKVAAPTRAKVGASEFSTGRGSALRAQAPKRLTGTTTAPNDAATSANDELSRRKQNQFVPWFTTLAATVTGNPKVVTDFIASSNADAYKSEIDSAQKNVDAKQAEVDATRAQLADAVDPRQALVLSVKLAAQEAELATLTKSRDDVVGRRDRQTAQAQAAFQTAYDGAIASGKSPQEAMQAALATYHDYVFYHSGAPVEVTGPVFAEGKGDASDIDPNDVNQRGIGDCWLMCSLQELAQHDPDALRNMIRDNGDGTYTVTFYKKENGKAVPFEVTVDDQFASGHTGTGDKGELWPLIIEKAYAEVKGSYGGLDGGFPNDAMFMLTGESYHRVEHGQTSAADFAKYGGGEVPMEVDTCSSSQAFRDEYGLVGGHAYSVKEIYTDADGKQWVVLSNPWGSHDPKPIPLEEAAAQLNLYVKD